jgi:hypothetical protein
VNNEFFNEDSIAPSGWRCSNAVLRYCTVRPIGALWRLTAGVPSLFLTAGAKLPPSWRLARSYPLPDGWSNPPPFWRLARSYPLPDGWSNPTRSWRLVDYPQQRRCGLIIFNLFRLTFVSVGENGVILDKIFIFQLFLFVFIFYEIFFTYIVKYPLVYLLYFLFFFPFENKGVVTIFTKSIFCTFVKKRGVKLDRRCLRLDSAN